MYRIKYPEKTFRYKGKMVTITSDRDFSESDDFYQKFKSHFVKSETGKVVLNEEPIDEAKVEIVQEPSETVIAIEEDKEEEKEAYSADYTLLNTKEELVKYIEDNEIDVSLGNLKNIDKIKAKIASALES